MSPLDFHESKRNNLLVYSSEHVYSNGRQIRCGLSAHPVNAGDPFRVHRTHLAEVYIDLLFVTP